MTADEIKDVAQFGKVAVLMGGLSAEREISLLSGNAVLDALKNKGVDAHGWDPAENTITALAEAGFDRVWIALHGPGGEDGAVQGALQWLGLPYTGSGVMASALAMDKIRSKKLFRAVGLDTPDYVVLNQPGDANVAAAELGFPMVVKPAGEGSSVGISKVFEEADLQNAVEMALGAVAACLVNSIALNAPRHGIKLEGLEITADMYTYTAGATGLDAAMPPWVQEGGDQAWIARLQDPAIRRQVIREMRTPTDEWESLYLAAGSADNVLLVGFRADELKPLTGKTLAKRDRMAI